MACKRSLGFSIRHFFYHLWYGCGIIIPSIVIQLNYLHAQLVLEKIKPIEVNGDQLDFVIEELFQANDLKDPSKYPFNSIVMDVITKVVDEACSQANMTLVHKISLLDICYNTELFGAILINGTIAKSLE